MERSWKQDLPAAVYPLHKRALDKETDYAPFEDEEKVMAGRPNADNPDYSRHYYIYFVTELIKISVRMSATTSYCSISRMGFDILVWLPVRPRGSASSLTISLPGGCRGSSRCINRRSAFSFHSSRGQSGSSPPLAAGDAGLKHPRAMGMARGARCLLNASQRSRFASEHVTGGRADPRAPETRRSECRNRRRSRPAGNLHWRKSLPSPAP